jgi:hypothetical protein
VRKLAQGWFPGKLPHDISNLRRFVAGCAPLCLNGSPDPMRMRLDGMLANKNTIFAAG